MEYKATIILAWEESASSLLPSLADPFHKHIVSGDIDSIVENKELANLLRKGPKYREPVPLNFEKAKS